MNGGSLSRIQRANIDDDKAIRQIPSTSLDVRVIFLLHLAFAPGVLSTLRKSSMVEICSTFQDDALFS